MSVYCILMYSMFQFSYILAFYLCLVYCRIKIVSLDKLLSHYVTIQRLVGLRLQLTTMHAFGLKVMAMALDIHLFILPTISANKVWTFCYIVKNYFDPFTNDHDYMLIRAIWRDDYGERNSHTNNSITLVAASSNAITSTHSQHFFLCSYCSKGL